MSVRGSDAVIAVYDETAYKTVPGSPDGRLLYFTELTANASRENIISNTISADRNRVQPGQGNLDVSITANVEVAPESIGWWLKHLLGVPTSSGASAPYTHTYRPTTLPVGFIIEQDWTAKIANKVHRYLGCRLTQGSISIPQSGLATFNGSIGGADFAIATAALDATLTDPGHTAWSASQVVVKIAGTQSCLVRDVTFNINNNMDTDRYTLCGGTRYDMPEGFADVSGEITAIFDTATHTLIENALARTDTTLEVILTHGTGAGTAGNEQLSIKLDHALIALASPPITSPAGIQMSFTFNAFKSGATDKGLVVVLKNAIAAANL